MTSMDIKPVTGPSRQLVTVLPMPSKDRLIDATVAVGERELIAALCHFEVSKKPDFYLVHNESEDNGGCKNARDDRQCKRRHQYSSKRQRADYQDIQNTRNN